MGVKKELLDHITTQLDTIIELLAQLVRDQDEAPTKSP